MTMKSFTELLETSTQLERQGNLGWLLGYSFLENDETVVLADPVEANNRAYHANSHVAVGAVVDAGDGLIFSEPEVYDVPYKVILEGGAAFHNSITRKNRV